VRAANEEVSETPDISNLPSTRWSFATASASGHIGSMERMPTDYTLAWLRREPSRATQLGAALLCSATLASCGGTTLVDPSNADGGSTDSDSGVEICDGSAGVRVAATSGGGGLVPPWLNMIGENGFAYLLVSGQCEAWVLKEAEAPLRHLMLSREQARALSRDFRLGEWSSIPPAMGGCADASAVSFRFENNRLSGVPCGLPAGHPLREMSTAFFAQIANLSISAVDAEGDARYVLAAEDPDAPRTGDAYRDAPPWPLPFSPDSVAVSLKDFYSYRRGTSRRAIMEEASQLRALRRLWLEGKIGSKMIFFIPIAETDGARFQLYVRDSSPWENASGLLPDDLTAPPAFSGRTPASR